MKRVIVSAWLLLVCAVGTLWGQEAKFVFYFIGDGMGLNQVNGAEAYRAELEGRIGVLPLFFSQFPYATVATTYSATNGVTDSAASGTALATGHKTRNGVIGMNKERDSVLTSVAVWAKENGARVGISTSVSVDHATPSAFYAHVPDRGMYYQIGKDLITAGFDFYAGSDFLKPVDKKASEEGSLYEQCEQGGYTIARGYKEYRKKMRKAEKMILMQSEKASRRDRSSIPYAIDRERDDMTLAEITRAGVNFLSKDLSKGFFFMVEGGKIDWACHANDAATVFQEVIDLDDAVRVAYEFYEQHPDETLIVVTADHETGGLALGTGAYALNLQALKYQQMSVNKFSRLLNDLRAQTGNKVTWEMARRALEENFGFWTSLKLNDRQEKRLKRVFEENFLNKEAALDASEYQKDERLATVAKEIINEIALVGWMSGSHSDAYVPVFAIGAGAEKFCRRTDNAEIPLKIAEAAGWR